MTETITRKLAGRTYSVDVPTFERKGERAITDADLARAELAIAAGVAADGPVSAEGFRFMRKAANLKAAELGELLGVTPKTISRWENGAHELDRTAWLAIGDIVLELAGKPIEARARLERIAVGFKPPKERRVSL